MFGTVHAFLVNLAFGVLLRPAPRLQIPREKAADFDTFATRVMAANGETVPWDLPYPLHEFTRYLVREHAVLLHGSPRALDTIEPARQTDSSGTPVTAVFATDDGIWPLFFATLDRTTMAGGYSLRNAAIVVGHGTRGRRHYVFSLDRDSCQANAFGRGFLHVIPREGFQPSSQGIARFAEWVGEGTVAPLARIEIAPRDFPFHARISAHRRGEWFPLTWLFYRWRTRRDSLWANSQDIPDPD